MSECLTVSTEEAIAYVGIASKNAMATRKAWYRFHIAVGLKPIPGTKNRWSVEQIKRAVNGKETK